MHGDQVPGAPDLRRHVDPARLEAEFRELAREDVADLAHAGVILGRAVDVDRLGQQAERLGLPGVDGSHDPLFLRVEGQRLCRDATEQCSNQRSGAGQGASVHAGDPG